MDIYIRSNQIAFPVADSDSRFVLESQINQISNILCHDPVNVQKNLENYSSILKTMGPGKYEPIEFKFNHPSQSIPISIINYIWMVERVSRG